MIEERPGALGSFTVRVKESAPSDVVAAFEAFGRVLVTESRESLNDVGLASALYPSTTTYPNEARLLLPDNSSSDNVTTPDSAALDVTGDLEIRGRLGCDDWSPGGSQVIVDKLNPFDATDGGYQLLLNGDGTLLLRWSDGSSFHSEASTVAVRFADIQVGWVRATVDVDDGGGNYVVTFYTSTDPINAHGDVAWTQLGDAITTAGTTSIAASTFSVKIGSDIFGNNRVDGEGYAAVILDGLGGTEVANPIFADEAAGTTSFDDAAGNTWTLNGATEIAGATDLYPADVVLPRIARWAGVVVETPSDDDGYSLTGHGLALYLGDGSGLADIIEDTVTFTDADIETVTRKLVPSALTVGTIADHDGTWTGTHQYETPRAALDRALGGIGAEWRINPDASIDVGAAEVLFASGLLYPGTDEYPGTTTYPLAPVPTAVMATTVTDGHDPRTGRGVHGAATVGSDGEDYTTRVLVVTTDADNNTVLLASADIEIPTPYRDPHGNALARTRIVSVDSDTPTATAQQIANLQAGRFDELTRAVDLTVDQYVIDGTIEPGGWVDVWDPTLGLVDYSNERIHRGQTIWPLTIRVRSMSWPIEQGMGVYFAAPRSNELIDLTDWVEFEDGSATRIEVGVIDHPVTSN